MTSSGTPTDRSRDAGDQARGRAGIGSWVSGRNGLAIAASLLVAGWLLVLYVHNWRFEVGVLFLWIGWLSILLIGRFLWQAAFAMATEPEDDADQDDDGFEVAATRREELEREKRSLLKAIKEVEFDRALGKMSDEDAEEIILFYRVRAIEVLRQLERIERGEEQGDLPASVSDLIDREVHARLALFGGRKEREEREEREAARAQEDADADADAADADAEDEEPAPAKAKEAK